MTGTYRHTQVGYGFLAVVGGLAVWSAVAAARSPGAAGPLVGMVVAAACAALFPSLTVTVDGERLAWRFGAGLLRGSVDMAQVAEVRPVRNSPLHGWGIRFFPDGRTYNVSGLDAVEVVLRSGRRIRLGTDEPRALTEAILRARAGAPPPET